MLTVTTDTYYTVLGVSENAGQAEIKRAWQELLKQVHPDKLGSAPDYWRKVAEDKTKEVNEAFQVLSNTAKRQQYDQLLEALREAQAPPQYQAPPPQREHQAPPHTYNPSPQPPGTPASSQTTPTRFGTGRYDWAAIITVPQVLIVVAAANETPRPNTTAIVGALFLQALGFLLVYKKHRWLSILPFLVAFDIVFLDVDTRKPTPAATFSVVTPKSERNKPFSNTVSTLKTGTNVTVYNDDGTESDKPWEIDWSTYSAIPDGTTLMCPGEDFARNELVKHDNCRPIPAGVTGRAKNINGVWFDVKMIPPASNPEGLPSEENAKAQYVLGSKYFNSGDYIQAALWYQKAAELGNMEAQYQLASIYNCGCYGLLKDDTLATFWLRKAAEQGNQFAQRDLGKMYHGHGDNSEAGYWYRKAAEQGNEESRVALHEMGEQQ